ncbi:MAG: N-formylglutamate deformylase [Proteobacteria bacterium]|nr:MAG: N-formylglutamate deformylase [Pseudomonadota bacterium]
MKAYDLQLPKTWKVPIIVSTPHVGTDLPIEIQNRLNPLAANLPDTDWFVDQLYDFAESIGVPLLRARYSRYVIDLNRPVAGASLYSDNRRQTEVIPSTTFEGVPLYLGDYQVDEVEFHRREELYYKPYYGALKSLIGDALSKFGKVLLWDGHSITRVVKSIQSEPFPDLMLGDRDGHTSHPRLVEIAQRELSNSAYSVAYNAPFKGGQITRFHGHSAPGVFAMQLEMSQDIYMTDGRLDQKKTDQLKPVLQRTLEALAEGMLTL